MLTKGQARSFFLGGTVLFSLIFVGLTIDSMKQVPAQTNEDQITPETAHGKRIWEENNCMGCHTLFGEGAYYAPELTKVIERRGKPWLRIFLKDPEAMFPGERKMVNYHFNDEEIEAVIAFLDWCGKVDLNGFPAEPPLKAKMLAAMGGPSGTLAEPPEVFSTICAACHAVGGSGGNVGPALDTAYERYTPESMRAWLLDPQSVKPGTAMPKLPLTDTQLDELVTFLQSLGETHK